MLSVPPSSYAPMMFLSLVSGAAAWTVGAPVISPVVTSPMVTVPAVHYAPPAAAPFAVTYVDAPAEGSSTAAWAAVCGLGALAGFAVGRHRAALAVSGKPA